MAYEIRRSALAQYNRDVRGVNPVMDVGMDPSKILASDSYFQTPSTGGFSPVPVCDLPSQSNLQWNLQPRILHDDLMRLNDGKLNINTRLNGSYYLRVDDVIEEELSASEMQSPKHYEDGYSHANNRVGHIPIHKRGSSPTSVLNNSRDAWNLLYDTPGRIHPLDYITDLHGHVLDRSGYLMGHQMGSPRSTPYCNSPFAPCANASFPGSNRGYAHIDSTHLMDRNVSGFRGVNPDTRNWSQNNHGLIIPMQRPQAKLNHPNLCQDRGYQLPNHPSNPRTPMRAVFVTERSGQTRESSGTGVFLPRCVGGGSDFNRKPTCSPVLLPIWNDSTNPRQSTEVNQRQSPVNLSVQEKRHSENNDASFHSQMRTGFGSDGVQECKSKAEVLDFDGLELPSEWVY